MSKRKVKSWKSDTRPEAQMILRMVDVKRETADDENKSIDVVIATENPVQRYMEEYGEVVSEYLPMDGLRLRNPNKPQMPIVDSHDRSTTRNVFGSVRNLRVENGEFVGTSSFARDQDSQDAYYKLKDGHVTDFSVTANPMLTREIRRGEQGEFAGQSIDGPALIHDEWMPTDASIVAVGADRFSTARSELLRSYFELERIKRMNATQRDALVKKGMPEDLTTTEQALEWMLKNAEPEEEVEVVDDEETTENMDDEESSEHMDDEETENMDDEEKVENEDDEKKVENAVDRALKADAARRKEILALCSQAGIKRSLADSWCNNRKASLEIVREKVLERMMTKKTERVEVTSSGADKTHAAMRDGLISRAMSAIPPARDRFGNTKERKPTFEGRQPAAGYQDFQHMGLLRMAEQILRTGGVNTVRMTPQQIALCALGHQRTIERLKHSGVIQRDDAWHTTGTLPNLMLDAQNKTLLAGYEEAEFTWKMWARQAPSAPDLRSIHRIKFSEAPDPQVVPEGKTYPEGKTSDDRESYKVEKYGGIFSITWETIVNDDLDAISRIPQMHGAACRRKQNKVVYAVLTDNAAMRDGVALFNASHSNLAGSGAVISTAALNAAYSAMRVQTNLGGELISVVPQFLIVPAAIEATAWSLVNSIADPSVGGDTTGSSGVANIYGPQGKRRLTVVGEPQLDGNSTTAWYLAAGNMQIDTVELCFLQGEESPVLEQEWDFDTDTFKNKVRQTFAAAAIDHRGMYKNPGA